MLLGMAGATSRCGEAAAGGFLSASPAKGRAQRLS